MVKRLMLSFVFALTVLLSYSAVYLPQSAAAATPGCYNFNTSTGTYTSVSCNDADLSRQVSQSSRCFLSTTSGSSTTGFSNVNCASIGTSPSTTTPPPATSSVNRSVTCESAAKFKIFGFPRWYEYLPSDPVQDGITGAELCQPKLEKLIDIWKVVAAVIEILLRLSSLIAIGFIVYGGISYTLSQGSPDKTKQALSTIINALVGMVIAIISAALVGYIAGRF